MPTRTPDEIRASIEQNRQELGHSLEKLRVEVQELTDWRSQLRRNQRPLTIGAGVAGFLVGGGLAGVGSLVFGGRRRRAARTAARAVSLPG
jgi:Protein of unknown function (DUF3618)